MVSVLVGGLWEKGPKILTKGDRYTCGSTSVDEVCSEMSICECTDKCNISRRLALPGYEAMNDKKTMTATIALALIQTMHSKLEERKTRTTHMQHVAAKHGKCSKCQPNCFFSCVTC